MVYLTESTGLVLGGRTRARTFLRSGDEPWRRCTADYATAGSRPRDLQKNIVRALFHIGGCEFEGLILFPSVRGNTWN